MTITRIWHGYTTPGRADEYEALLKAEVIKGLEDKNVPGFRGIDVLRRPLGDKVEFITIMEFDDIDSVKALIGDDYEQAHVPDDARVLLTRFDVRSQHYEVRESRTYAAAPLERATAASSEPVIAVEPASFSVADAETTTAELQPTTSRADILPDGAWFVKKDRGNGSVPVTRDGFRVVLKFVLGMVAWAIASAAIAVAGAYAGSNWLTIASPLIFAGGALLTAWYFVGSARKHTDYSITYSEFLKARHHA